MSYNNASFCHLVSTLVLVFTVLAMPKEAAASGSITSEPTTIAISGPDITTLGPLMEGMERYLSSPWFDDQQLENLCASIAVSTLGDSGVSCSLESDGLHVVADDGCTIAIIVIE